jgi:hypothetical protein
MKPDAIHLLNRLLAIMCRSFPQYLRYARPHVPAGRGDVLEALEAVALDEDVLAERISRAIIDAGALPRTGEFPMEFTDLHDLDVDYLVKIAVRYQEQDAAAIQEVVEGLQTAPAAKALAEEALGLAKGHLDSLYELTQQPAAAVPAATTVPA